MISSDIERLRKIVNDTKRRTFSLRQLSFLFYANLLFTNNMVDDKKQREITEKLN